MRVEDGIDAKLDYALEMTFPASDPFTIYLPEADDATARSLSGRATAERLARCDASNCSTA